MCHMMILYHDNLRVIEGGKQMKILKMIVYLVYLAWAWSSLSYLQNAMGLTLFMDMRGFAQVVITKFILATLFGVLIIPIALIHKLLKR